MALGGVSVLGVKFLNRVYVRNNSYFIPQLSRQLLFLYFQKKY